ncbi:MAG TPA: hypothetical protein VE569_02315, partial [Acidimicrobiia bacterium]|nr:hypothetical protein [Acidimicrobiia bacterium]
RLAAGGATATTRIEVAYRELYGGPWAESGQHAAIEHNWIKAFPCCLQTHSSIEAADIASSHGADPEGKAVVTVHPRSRQAAPFDDVTTGTEAKFSIPYTVAMTVALGPPTVESLTRIDDRVKQLASRVEVRTDDSLQESEAILEWHGGHHPIVVRVDAARGSPQRPMTDDELQDKVHSLAGTRLDGALDDLGAPAGDVLALITEP